MIEQLLDYKSEDLEVLEVYRHLRGRRITALAYYQGQYVVIKCFADADECAREQAGHALLQANGFRVPVILDQLNLRGHTVLVFERIEDVQNWFELSTEAFDDHFIQLIALFKKLHALGYVHTDPHLDNFLLTTDGIVMVDSAAIQKRYRWNPLAPYWNLAYLLAQVYPAYRLQLKAFIDSYFDIVNPLKRALVMQLVKWQHGKRMRRYLKKIFRDCTEFSVSRGQASFTVSRRSLALDDQFDPESLPVLRYLKQGNTATVWQSELAGQPVVVKRYNDKGWLWRIRQWFKTPRGRLSWRNAHLLQALGFKTPTPLVYNEQYAHGIMKQAYFISAFVSGKPAHLHIEESGISDGLLKSLRTLFQRMQAVKICQSDSKASNILVRALDEVPYLIDLDSVQSYRVHILFIRRWRKSWRRWLKNWQPQYREKFEQL